MFRLLRPAVAGLAALALFSAVACSDKVQTAASTDRDDAPAQAQETATRTEQPANPTSSSSNATAAPPRATSTAVPGSRPTQAPPATTVARPDTDLSVADLVKLAEPSVVRIETSTGVGTGFVIGSDGYIMTNNHVVDGARTIRVTMSDGGEYPGSIVGVDSRSDLALIRIEASGLQALAIGKLDDVVVGQDVVAIGYALDLKRGEGPSYSVTRGIISAKNRGIDEGSVILGAIQTDAAINHGNSGGPLLNLRGEVVGVNTALAPDPSSSAGVASGIGFAVGADTVEAVFEQLRDTGRVNRGLLGIANFSALRPAKARDLGIPDVQGVLLGDTTTGPALSAGLRSGDVITKIGDTEIRNESELAVAMIKNGPGTQVDVEYYRDGQKETATVTLGNPGTN
jgi:S1-C subfamily serine protease